MRFRNKSLWRGSIWLLLILGLVSVVAVFSSAGTTYTIEGVISGLTGKHTVNVLVFDQPRWVADFNRPLMRKSYPASAIQNTQLKYSFSVPPGIYGITFVEDLDGNGTMTLAGIIGYPQEPFGFSRNFNPFRAWRQPRFDEFCFRVDQNITGINIRALNTE